MPWVMGEFCDYDTVRNLPALGKLEAGRPPWWMQAEAKVNPQGARWEQRLPTHALILHQNGLWERLDELCRASYRQGMLHRKFTLETVRSDPDLSGYVITGETDTPISTAGMWDNLNELKFPAEEFRRFNQDTVLLLGWNRRRSWTAGGDRVSPRDRWNYPSGEVFRANLMVAHLGRQSGVGRLGYSMTFPGEDPFTTGAFELTCKAGAKRQAGVIQFQVPQVAAPRQAELHAWLTLGTAYIENRWPLWFYPPNPWQAIRPFTLVDPLGILNDLPATGAPVSAGGIGESAVTVCTCWTPELQEHVEAGEKAILIQQKGVTPSPVEVIEAPFWREALKLVEPHPAWGDFPHQDDPGMQFYALATDCALDASRGSQPARPLLRRLDTRGMTLLEYAIEIEWGKGRLLATTLRLHGGLGDQPVGISRSPAAINLLANWLRYLCTN
jgi:hypothetical protein